MNGKIKRVNEKTLDQAKYIWQTFLYEKHLRILDYSNLTVSQQFSYRVKLKFKLKVTLIEI